MGGRRRKGIKILKNILSDTNVQPELITTELKCGGGVGWGESRQETVKGEKENREKKMDEMKSQKK